MTKKIFHSIMTVAAAVLLASLVIIMGALYDYFGAVQENQLKNQLSLAASALESLGQSYLEELPEESFRLTWIAGDGTVVYDTKVDAATMENHSGRAELQEALSTGEGESVRYSSTLLKKTEYYARALTDGTVLRISVDRATVGMLTLGMAPAILLVLLAALLLSGILASKLSRRIVEPLNQLDLERPTDNLPYEELAPLLTRINSQHREIARQLRLLQQKKDEFSQITGNMREALVLLDGKGAVLSINPTALKLFHAESSCVGQDFLTVDRSRELSLALTRAIESGHSEIRTERDGLEYQFDISRIDYEGEGRGAVLLAFDVSEEAFAERNRREFTANVSHELKTPLQSIIGSAELIETGLVKEEDMPRFIGHIRQEAARLVTLIEDIIRLSQLDEGLELPMEQVELKELALEVADNLAAAAEEKNVDIHVQGESLWVMGIRRLLYEVIFNLCDNAIKYNVQGGRVDIQLSEDTQKVIVAVSDTGIGIPVQHQSRIFQRFYRVDKSHSRESGGTGLGLSIVKHAVQYHQGSISVESTPGQGTKIEISLPKNQ